MSYNRKNAVSYAYFYWWKVCHDQYIATTDDAPGATPTRPFIKVDPDTYFDGGYHARNRSGRVLDIDYIEDCTHFMSCCVGERGGGLKILNDFPQQGPYGRLAPHKDVTKGMFGLFDSLMLSGQAVILGTEKTNSLTIPSALEEWDLIVYWNGSAYQHMAMYLGKDESGIGMITCHSTCRWLADWRLGLPNWTFLHIK